MLASPEFKASLAECQKAITLKLLLRVAFRKAYARGCLSVGCSEVPAMEKKIVGKMGLKGVPGLRIAGMAGDRESFKGQGTSQQRRQHIASYSGQVNSASFSLAASCQEEKHCRRSGLHIPNLN